MFHTDKEIKLVLLGTKKSSALDLDETYIISFKKGEPFSPDINSIDEFIENAKDKAFQYGDVIKSLTIDNIDIIEETILESLIRNGHSTDEALVDLSSEREFANADPSDLHDMIYFVLEKISN
jgi:hypothetical protein